MTPLVIGVGEIVRRQFSPRRARRGSSSPVTTFISTRKEFYIWVEKVGTHIRDWDLDTDEVLTGMGSGPETLMLSALVQSIWCR